MNAADQPIQPDLSGTAGFDASSVDSLTAELQTIELANSTDWEGYRRAARRLIALGIAPARVDWQIQSSVQTALFAASAPDKTSLDSATSPLPPAEAVPPAATKVPPHFITLCQTAILHSNPARFGLLYRLLWRLQREPGLRHDPLDPDWTTAERMAQAVRRDLHKMKAFVRFRTVQDAAYQLDAASGLLHVAWFEPDHHIAEAAAPFFIRRFTQMRWAILTPDRSLAWNGHDLHLGPGACKADAPPADAGEALWLTYYQHIFNPARLKIKAMQKEMPRRYWKNLPEAAFISELSAQASERQHTMLEQAPTVPRRRIPQA